MLMGPYASESERSNFRVAIEARPRDFIAQPVIRCRVTPRSSGHAFAAPRRFAAVRAYGREIDVPPAALTRVALSDGSLVVNSSQGGGSKDTWILED